MWPACDLGVELDPGVDTGLDGNLVVEPCVKPPALGRKIFLKGLNKLCQLILPLQKIKAMLVSKQQKIIGVARKKPFV